MSNSEYRTVPLNNVQFLYELECINAESITPKQQPWLWYGIIPLDTSTLFVGEGGIGKSLLLIYLAARISRGDKFLACGEEIQFSQGKIIILSAEDDLEYQIRPKLIAADADCSQIEIIKYMKETASQKKQFLDLDKHLDLLEEKIKKMKNVKMVIIDPISYFTGDLKDHINTRVANFLNALNDIAKKYNLAIILNKHFRKQSSGNNIMNAMSEVAGCGSWVNTPRAAHVIARHPEDKQKICIVDLKANLKEKGLEAHAYKIISDKFTFEDKIITTTKLIWFEEMVKISADDALNEQSYFKSKEQIAYDFILKYLNEHKIASGKDITDTAIRNGIAKRTFENAFKKLKDEQLIEKSDSIGALKRWRLKNNAE